MAVKKTQMYRKNLDTSETNLYPLTEAQYVSMENGQTVQEVLSDRDSDKYTPVITNSSSTFKVGQGDNVDLSSSMKEGAYDSCVLKGKTMVNCIQEPSSQDVVLPYEFEDGQYVTINDTKESGALGVELKGQTLVNLIDFSKFPNTSNATRNNDTITVTATTDSVWINCSIPLNNIVNDKTYIVCWDSLNFTHTHSNGITEVIGIYTFDENGKNQRTIAKTVSNENNYIKFNIPSSTTFTYVKIKIHATTYGSELGATTTVKGVKVIEYQEGMENWNIPYFEGMASCKMPILKSVGKNLFDGDNFTRDFIVSEIGTLVAQAGNGATDYIRVLKGNTYIKKRNNTIAIYDINKKFIERISSVNSYTAESDGYIRWNIDGYTRTDDYENGLNLLQIEEGSTATTYEPHKSSILSLPEEVVLRSLPNGVCDTFNTRTGVHTQRIKEVVFDGSDDEAYSYHSSQETLHRYISNMPDMKVTSKQLDNSQLHCDKWATVRDNMVEMWSVAPNIHRRIADDRGALYFTVDGKSNVAQFREYLSQNPITVQYELATPIVTKVNLSSILKSWNTTTHIYSEIPENTLYPILSHSNPTYPVILKPSTKYSIVANSYSNSHTNSAINFNLGGATASTTVGNRVTTITTPSTLSNELLAMSGRGNKLNNVMVIEGDVVGDEPYFEGICDCKSPILSNVGKNLFDSSVEIVTGYGINSDSGAEYGQSLHSCTGFLRMKPNTTYTIAQNHSDSWAFAYDSDKKYIGLIRANIKNGSNFTTPSNTHYIRLDFLSVDILEITNGVCIEENTDSTAYEPYKSNTTTFEQKDDKTIVLRSLPSGVCDTLNVETGEYVQRIGEVILDGSSDEDWSVLPYTPYENGTHYQFKYYLGNPIGGDLWQNAQAITSDTLPSQNYKLHWNGTGEYGIGGDVNYFMITWKKQSSPFTDVTTLRAWLSQNPTTIQYELETPIVSTIDMQGFPYAYTNGHVQLSSGHSGQSLTPTVEYSLSANKTGQINSNSKIVMKHQKQLDDFEAMMLTSMVQSAYDKAILQFDYEMQMMSLGGE